MESDGIDALLLNLKLQLLALPSYVQWGVFLLAGVLFVRSVLHRRWGRRLAAMISNSAEALPPPSPFQDQDFGDRDRPAAAQERSITEKQSPGVDR
jgi:hypothetical protein